MNEISITVETTQSEVLSDSGLREPAMDELSMLEADPTMPIAIVGMGFRGPGDATSIPKLWDMILEQREGWRPIPASRWNNTAFYHPDHAHHGTTNVSGGHFMEQDLSLFDAPFFNMTSDEAAAMDPQQRLLLEVTYEGLENGGLPLAQVMGSKTACFVGSFSADYTDLLLRDPECVPMYQCTNAGQSRAMMANRVSYFYDLKGPSVTVDTACSGSLVALHLACRSLQTGDAAMAIAAGVNLILSHEFMATMSMMRFLAPDGRCYTFDEKASGYARGEAIGCLVLKPLAAALRDRNTVRAIIRGTGSNQDGRTPGITLPSGIAQEALIREVYGRAGLDPSETEVVEAHGTGTQAGDPVETGAIARVFGAGRSPLQPLRIGSIKTNVGHLEGASGVAGVIKAVLMLENRMILPSRNFEKVNSRIPLHEWNLKVQLSPEPWETAGPHRVSVNSFGYGGSNAHVIVEEASSYLTSRGLGVWHQKPSSTFADAELTTAIIAPKSTAPRHRIFMISGFDEGYFSGQIQSLSEYLQAKTRAASEEFLDDLAFTLNEHRSRFIWKAALTGSSTEELIASLSNGFKPRSSVRKPTLAFVFTGQGAQWAGMGKELLRSYPVFRHSITHIDKFLTKIGAPFLVHEELCKYPDNPALNRPLLSQTVCTALQIALVDLLASWSIYPESVTGHSSGEIAAAYACGALSMEDAMAVAYYRGVAASELLTLHQSKGAMMAVGMSAEDTQPYLAGLTSGKAVVACINSPSSVTVSGDVAAIDELVHLFKDTPVFSRRLVVDVAYHSHHMELVANEYLLCIEHITPRSRPEPHHSTEQSHRVSFFSSVTGTELQNDDLGADYWIANLLGQVNFAQSLRTLCFETNSQNTGKVLPVRKREKRTAAAQKPSVDFLLEIGPHSALSGPIKQIIQADIKLKSADISYASLLSRKAHSVSSTIEAVATLASLNYAVDLKAINFPSRTETEREPPRLLVDMPSYTWNHTRSYWAEPRMSKTFRNRESPRTDLLGTPDTMACPFQPRWRNHLRVSELPWLVDHKIQSDIVFPAAGYISIAIEAVVQLAKNSETISEVSLQDISISAAMIIPDDVAVETMTLLQHLDQGLLSEPGQWYKFHIYSVSKDNRWTEHCSGLVGIETESENFESPAAILNGASQTSPKSEDNGFSEIDVDKLYARLRRVGLEYGPCFSNLSCAHTTPNACVAEVIIPDTADVMPMNFEFPLMIHPCTLDSVFHTIFAALPSTALDSGPIIPVSLAKMRVSFNIPTSAGEILSVSTTVRSSAKEHILASIDVAGNQDDISEPKLKLSISGLRCKRLEISSTHNSQSKEVPIAYGIEWKADPEFLSGDQLSLYLQPEQNGCARQPTWRDGYDHHVADLISEVLATVEKQNTSERSTSSGILADLGQMLQRYNEYSNAPAFGTESTAMPKSIGRLLNVMREGIFKIQDNVEGFMQPRSNLWDAYWEVLAKTRIVHKATRYLDLVSHKAPDISVLEIGVSAGQPCTLFLEQLIQSSHAGNRVPRCRKYTFAYQQDSDLDQVRLQIEQWPEVVEYLKLDIDRDVSDQGLTDLTYDVIIVPHGLHSVKSPKHALSTLHSLLKSTGSLIILDVLHPDRSLLDEVLTKALYTWSTGNIDLPRNYELTRPEWIQLLHGSGFLIKSGRKKSQNGPREGLVIATTSRIDIPSTDKDFLIISNSAQEDEAVGLLQKHLSQISSDVGVTTMTRAQVQDRVCVVFDTAQFNPLVDPDDNTFAKLKELFLDSEGVIWVTQGGTIESTNPTAGLVSGFARTARSESGTKPIITLDLDAVSPLPALQVSDIILDLIKAHFLHDNVPSANSEHAERNGTILIPRVIEQPEVDQEVLRASEPETKSEQYFRQQEKPLRLQKDASGTIKPYFTPDAQLGILPYGFIGIEVLAFSLGEWDIQEAAEGSPQIDHTPGMECSGRVYAIGANVTGLTVGDRVVCLGTGTGRSFYHDRASAFYKIDNIPYNLAAALPGAYSTAYYIVRNVACVRPSDTVLIHDAASWCGQAILELCLLRNASVLLNVMSSGQKEMLTRNFPILTHRVFVDGDDDLNERVRHFTNGKKVDVAIVCAETSESIYQTFWKYIAPFGRFIRLQSGGTDGEKEFNLMRHPRNSTFATVNLIEFQTQKADLARHLWGKVSRLFREGRLRGPSSLAVYNVTELEEALESIPSQKHVIVTAETNRMVQTMCPKDLNALFDGAASYLLVGGLGGIGRAIALWMTEHGAKHLVLINRSGLRTEAAKSTLRELHGKGIDVAVYPCDISNETEVQQVLSSLPRNTPPIRGVIQGAMVLKDMLIEKMTADDYNAVLGPRYSGTWNLHKHLPTDLDFFLMLSSISGIIGNATQAAYAAGSAFMDSFAAYRHTFGLPAVSLDLGTITGVGYLAENKELAAKMEKQGFQGTDTQTLLSLVQTAISQQKQGRSQIVTGLGEWKAGESLANFDAPLFSHFRRRFWKDERVDEPGDSLHALRENLRTAESHDDAVSMILEALASKIASQLGISMDRVDPSSPLSEFGIDSHVAVELRNWISKTMESTVPILEILASDSVLHLAGHIATRSRLVTFDERLQ